LSRASALRRNPELDRAGEHKQREHGSERQQDHSDHGL
jgi:hypothetical protein